MHYSQLLIAIQFLLSLSVCTLHFHEASAIDPFQELLILFEYGRLISLQVFERLLNHPTEKNQLLFLHARR